MKKLIILMGIVLIPLMNSKADDFYSVSKITEIKLYFEQENWDDLLDNLYSAGDEERLIATCYVDGEQFDSVGVRYKGNSSYRPQNKKNPLNIKLDHIIDDQELDGFGTLKLSNGYKDPTIVREILAYEIARNYFPAPMANYAKVYINDDYIGVYTSVQSVDKYFYDSHFGSRDNPAFKGELVGNSQQVVSSMGYLGEDSSDYTSYYELRSDYGWKELIDFLDTFNNDPDNMENSYNVDRHLWKIAFDNLTVNLDAPINFAHNFYLYQSGNGQFQIIPWDFNESFGCFANLLDGPPLNTSGLQQLNPFLNESNNNYPIVKKVLEIPRYKRMYVAHMRTMIEEYFKNDKYLERAYYFQDIIKADLIQDNNKFYNIASFESNITDQVGMGPQSMIGIKQLMDYRVDFLSGVGEFKAEQPIINNIEYSPEKPSQNESVSISVKIENADYAFIAHRNNEHQKYSISELYDDGQHDDGDANDGIFGGEIISGTADIQYYIYAENNEAGIFSPARAAYEYYTIETEFMAESGIVINELLAKNDNTISDEEDEFDDWIELYNTGSDPVSLEGWYLTDSEDNPDKWDLPAVTINPDEYLVIWADEDGKQGELHANFKLSGSGESLTLSNNEMAVIDYISWESQETDISFGRYPNGVGSFDFMSPTPGMENTAGINSVVDETNEISNITSYPNPAYDVVNFSISGADGSSAKIIISNSLGDIVLKKSQITNTGNEISVNISKLPTGVYFVKIDTDSGMYTTRFTVLH